MPMPSPTQSKRTSSREKILRLALAGLMGALLVVGKQVMSGLPNIEPVTLLIVLFTLELPRETPAAITVFLLLQGVLYGFGLWWAMYIYVWYLLALLTWLLRRMDNALGWAVFSGIYGLCFGGAVCRRVSGGKDTGFCFELVDQRPALRCHARCGQFCADAAGLPPLAPCAADRKTADRPVNKEKRCPRQKPGAAFLCQGVYHRVKRSNRTHSIPGRFMMGASSSEIKKNRDSNIIQDSFHTAKEEILRGPPCSLRRELPVLPCIRLSRANYCRTLNVEKPG